MYACEEAIDAELEFSQADPTRQKIVNVDGRRPLEELTVFLLEGELFDPEEGDLAPKEDKRSEEDLVALPVLLPCLREEKEQLFDLKGVP